MAQDWNDQLEAAARWVSSWLISNCSRFRENLHELGGIDEVLHHLDKARDNLTHANDQYLFFQVEKNGEVVGAGFFETNGEYVLLHSLGLRDECQHCGIASIILAWYLASLPEASIDAICLAGVQSSNLAMRAWCNRFEAAEQTVSTDAMVLAFTVITACEVLNTPYPGDLESPFPRNWHGLSFQILYLGRHPHYLATGEIPICE